MCRGIKRDLCGNPDHVICSGQFTTQFTYRQSEVTLAQPHCKRRQEAEIETEN